MIRVGIVGVSGYAGGELCRWLFDHPQVDVVAAVSHGHAGKALADVVPALAGCTDLVCRPFDASLNDLDAVFLATPHGAAKDLAPMLTTKVLDLSADHRHAAGWVYGLAEWNAEAIQGAHRIAVPGCFATAIELSLAPFVAAGAVTGPICVAAATGSTGSGATPVAGTHHPERFANYRAYKPFQHQHGPEVQTALGLFGPAPTVHFVPHSAPIDRGIFATSFVPTSADAVRLVRDAYAGAPLIRLREQSPELRHVRGTAFADLTVHAGPVAAVLCAIDNLGKGAATQAVQCLNLTFGLPSSTGLLRAAASP